MYRLTTRRPSPITRDMEIDLRCLDLGLITKIKVLHRLCEYEDTGLTPEQIIQMKEELWKLKEGDHE